MIGFFVSKPDKYLHIGNDKSILFDSNKVNYPIYKQFDRSVDANGDTFKHELPFVPKIWVNKINGFTTNDVRIPISDSVVGNSDYKINNEAITYNGDTGKNIKIIIFARSINT